VAAAASTSETVPVPETGAVQQVPTWCNYTVSEWSVVEGRAVDAQVVEHSYAEVAGDELDPNDRRCSVCEQDQVVIDPSSFGLAVDPFEVCWAHADGVRSALEAIVESGHFDVVELTGYRPGRTRGPGVDGLRTQMSNHSYGTAIDVNAGHNGLYRGCDVEIGLSSSIDACELGIGGTGTPWRAPVPLSPPRAAWSRPSPPSSAGSGAVGSPGRSEI
jgi:hypothetical protein